MARDQALLESVQAGGPPVLRLYRWAPACLSLGRNQVLARPRELAAAASARGVDLVRRATGGAAVLHDRELTYAVAVPVGVLGSPRETYVAINRALVAGLRGLGVAAEIAAGVASSGRAGKGRGRAGRPGAPGADGAAMTTPNWENPCFQAPVPGEVVVGGLKLVGSAQRREGRTLLQHGSLLLAGDQGVVAECLVGEGGVEAGGRARGGAGAEAGAPGTLPSAPPGFTTLAALLDPVPPWSELTAAITAGFVGALGVELRPGGLTAAEITRIAPLTKHFQSPAWTWRR
jgi:lipoate-protein ligase A